MGAAQPCGASECLRSELGPEVYYADKIVDTVRAFKLIPDLIRRIDAAYPPPPPLADVAIVDRSNWWKYAAVAILAAALGASAVSLF